MNDASHVAAANLPVEIILRKMRIMLRIGIHAHERAPQPLSVSVQARGMIPPAPRDLGDVLDYERIRNYVQHDWPQRAHTDLLETLAVDLLGFIFQDPRIGEAEITLVKPDAFPETEGAGIRVRLSRSAWRELYATAAPDNSAR